MTEQDTDRAEFEAWFIAEYTVEERATDPSLRANVWRIWHAARAKDAERILERDTEPNNGWTIKFATLKALREQAQELNENPTEEEVEAVALAMVDLGYALIESSNKGITEKQEDG